MCNGRLSTNATVAHATPDSLRKEAADRALDSSSPSSWLQAVADEDIDASELHRRSALRERDLGMRARFLAFGLQFNSMLSFAYTTMANALLHVSKHAGVNISRGATTIFSIPQPSSVASGLTELAAFGGQDVNCVLLNDTEDSVSIVYDVVFAGLAGVRDCFTGLFAFALWTL